MEHLLVSMSWEECMFPTGLVEYDVLEIQPVASHAFAVSAELAIFEEDDVSKKVAIGEAAAAVS